VERSVVIDIQSFLYGNARDSHLNLNNSRNDRVDAIYGRTAQLISEGDSALTQTPVTFDLGKKGSDWNLFAERLAVASSAGVVSAEWIR